MGKTVNKNSPVIRIIVILVGIALILLAINDIGLITIGETTTAFDIQTNCYSSQADMNRDVDQQYKWTVTYKFIVNDKEYSGSETARGSSYGVKTNKTIYYYPFAPRINSMYAKDAVGWGTLACFLIGGFLILFMIKKPKKNNRLQGKTIEQVEAEMTSYDDSVEELFDEAGNTPTVYHNGNQAEAPFRTHSFCPYCGTKLDNKVKFCPECGASLQNQG